MLQGHLHSRELEPDKTDLGPKAHCKVETSCRSLDEQDGSTRPLFTSRSGSLSNEKEKSETGSGVNDNRSRTPGEAHT